MSRMNIKEHKRFNHQVIILGFGSIGRALLPLIIQALGLQPSQITIIAHDDSGIGIAQKFDVTFKLINITSNNYNEELGKLLLMGDFLVNVTNNISTIALVELCNEKGALYIDTSTEPWKECFVKDLSLAQQTNYILRENVLKLKGKVTKTALMTHGANPGLISYFVKQALCNLANDNELSFELPTNSYEWATLAMRLGIKAIHIAERDTQISKRPKLPGEFINTWSIDSLIEEGLQPAELGWGTHEKSFPYDGLKHDIGCQSAIYLNRPGADTLVRSWAPSLGAFQGFLITHPETSSIADFLTLKNGSEVHYRPTVHYAYSPCSDTTLSIFELKSNEWRVQKNKRFIFNEITDGSDELGVLLMGNEKGAYWFGSTLSIHEARDIVPQNNATSLQVIAGIFSGMIWAIEHPNEGLLEPEDIDHQYILSLALPYLGKVAGYYTDWTPLKNRGSLFSEELDYTDPWQFTNIRVK